MTVKIGQTIFSPWITPVRVVSDENQTVVSYYNGVQNDGVGALLTLHVAAPIAFPIDGVDVQVSDRVLLTAQTDANQNGIYIVTSIDDLYVVLQRAADQQSLDQYRTGQYVSIAAGTANAGKIYTLVEPLPAVIGVDDLTWSPVATSGGGSFYSGVTDIYFGGSATHTFTLAIPNLPGLVPIVNNYFTSNNVPIVTASLNYPDNPEELIITWTADPGIALVNWMVMQIQ
jgi:hypothetical protein